ncbi:hypothetical protein DFH27DRAFT_630018 [Peziza echinospora]|nr:hypothetical protein DFH27DRAFT_630018 [Peziza echinospora]
MILQGLRAAVQRDRVAAENWSVYLKQVTHAINTRVLRVHGFTPSELFNGFNERLGDFDEGGIMEEVVKKALGYHVAALEDEDGLGELVEGWQYETRLAKVDELREIALVRLLEEQDKRMIEQKRCRFPKPGVGDLVLLRRFIIDKDRGRKLEPRWEGPYLVRRMCKGGISGELEELGSGRLKGRYSVDAMKLYVVREEAAEVMMIVREDVVEVMTVEGQGMESSGVMTMREGIALGYRMLKLLAGKKRFRGSFLSSSLVRQNRLFVSESNFGISTRPNSTAHSRLAPPAT